MVHQDGGWNVDGTEPHPRDIEAEHDIAVGNDEVLVVTRDEIEQALPNELAGPGHRRPVAVGIGRAERPPTLLRCPVEDVGCEREKAEGDARMLDLAVRVEQLGAHDADAGL